MKAVIGQHANYMDTGVWTIENNYLISPNDLTESQLRDFILIFGKFLEENKVD